MKLTDLLNEGMYDKLVGEINKDIFKTIKAAMAGGGTQQKPKKYKGYPIYKEPKTNLGDMFQSEYNKFIYVGEERGGCTGTDDFFDLLENEWIRVEPKHNNMSWPAITDSLVFYERKN
jgi:hypothetical protein